VARAKRTDRAEARRRNRAASPSYPELSYDADEAAGGDAGATRSAPQPRQTRAAPAARAGLMDTLRRAAGRPNIGEDVRALPEIALHSKALWLPLLIIVATSLLFFVPGLRSNAIVTMLGQVALTPPPMIMPFLGGMLAPRAAWLVGGIIGIANALGFAVLVLANTSSQVTPLGWTYQVANDQKVAFIVNGIMSAVPFGLLVGAFAGFYRRFLASSAPARQQAKANAKRR
jgi:hypothetical protein